MMELAEEAATCMLGLDKSPIIGALWFFVIALMFFAQHHVCDAYFVPAINVFVKKCGASPNKWIQRWGEEAVAGATICALGCNGPELFTNLIALYTHSDAGIGVVVGSEIFNLLIIVGAAVMAAPILPLKLERVPFTRDVIFYFISIVLLYIALMDKAIDPTEAFVLLGAAAVYVICVYFTTDMVNCFACLKPEEAVAVIDGKKKGKMHGIEVEVEEINHSRMADGHSAGHSTKWNMDATARGIYAEPVDEPAATGQGGKPGGRTSIGFQFGEGGESMLGPVLRYKDLKEVVIHGEGVIELEFTTLMQHVTLKLTVPDIGKRDELLKQIEQYSLGRPYVHGYDPTALGSCKHLVHAIKDKNMGFGLKLFNCVEFLIDLPLKLMLFAVDVKDIRKEGRWPLCFMGAMFWLAIFSFLMLEVANEIHCNINALTGGFLGITVCAVGTSFPNAVASVLMAQQNKPAAAIANALGSNVQNVFLAMALPWVIYILYPAEGPAWQPIVQNVQGINEGVAWMMGTLILVVVFVLLPPFCALVKTYGYILCVVYLVYVGITSAEAFCWLNPGLSGEVNPMC